MQAMKTPGSLHHCQNCHPGQTPQYKPSSKKNLCWKFTVVEVHRIFVNFMPQDRLQRKDTCFFMLLCKIILCIPLKWMKQCVFVNRFMQEDVWFEEIIRMLCNMMQKKYILLNYMDNVLEANTMRCSGPSGITWATLLLHHRKKHLQLPI